MPRITVANIDDYRGGLTDPPSHLKCNIWDVFDKSAFDTADASKVVPLQSVVSTKDQRVDRKFLAGKKANPRQVALVCMQDAAAKQRDGRDPISVVEHSDGLFYVVNGNATVQVLMLAGWTEVPVNVVRR